MDNNEKEKRLTIFYAWLVTSNAYYIVTSALFFMRANRPTIRKRMVPLCALIVAGTLITGNTTLITTGYFSPVIPVPCGVRLVIQTLFAPLWLFGNCLRAVDLLYMSMVNQVMYDVSLNFSARPFDNMPKWKRIFLRTFSSRRQPSGTGGIKSVFSKSAGGLSRTDSTKSIADSEENDIISFSSGIRTTIIAKWVTGYFALCLTALIVEISVYPQHLDDLHCIPQQMYGRYIFQFLALITTSISLFLVKDVQDTKGLKWEVWASNLLILPLFIVYLLGSTFLDKDPRMTIPPFGPAFFTDIGHFLAHTATITWPLIDSYRDDWAVSRFVKNNSKQTVEAMMDMLKDPVMFRNFKQELVLEMAIENALYMESYFKIKRKLASHPNFSFKSEMLHIQSNFVSQTGAYALNLPSKVRKAFDAQLANGNCSADVLQPITEHVAQMMYSNTYPRFLKKIKSNSLLTVSEDPEGKPRSKAGTGSKIEKSSYTDSHRVGKSKNEKSATSESSLSIAAGAGSTSQMMIIK